MTVYDELFKQAERPYTINPPPFRVGVTLRIYHDDLDPDSVSDLMQLAPTLTQRRGDISNRKAKTKRLVRTGGWFLSSKGIVRSHSAEDHFDWLLDKLAHSATVLRKLRSQGYRMDVCCVWHADGFNVCPTLTAATMARLSALKLDTWFDIYLYGEPDET